MLVVGSLRALLPNSTFTLQILLKTHWLLLFSHSHQNYMLLLMEWALSG